MGSIKKPKPLQVVDWTVQGRTEALMALWLDGKSASHTAKVIGVGCTRSMVLGKVRRLKRAGTFVCEARDAAEAAKARLWSRKRQADKVGKIKRQEAREAFETAKRACEPSPQPARPEPPRAHGFEALEAIHTGCKWPTGDPGDPQFHFCGADRLGKGPYCVEHGKIAYAKVSVMRPQVDADGNRQARRGPKVSVGRLGLWA